MRSHTIMTAKPPPVAGTHKHSAGPAGPGRTGRGSWGYLSDDPETDDGITHKKMVELVKKGIIVEDTTVRGPGTGRQWVFAGRAPAIAKYLGVCPHCERPVTPQDQICVHCDRFLDVPDTAADLPPVGEGSIAKLRRWLHG